MKRLLPLALAIALSSLSGCAVHSNAPIIQTPTTTKSHPRYAPPPETWSRQVALTSRRWLRLSWPTLGWLLTM